MNSRAGLGGVKGNAGLRIEAIRDLSAAVERDSGVRFAGGQDGDAAGCEQRAQPDAEGERDLLFGLLVEPAPGVVASVRRIENHEETRGCRGRRRLRGRRGRGRCLLVAGGRDRGRRLLGLSLDEARRSEQNQGHPEKNRPQVRTGGAGEIELDGHDTSIPRWPGDAAGRDGSVRVSRPSEAEQAVGKPNLRSFVTRARLQPGQLGQRESVGLQPLPIHSLPNSLFDQTISAAYEARTL
jgi:hypothetical protein